MVRIWGGGDVGAPFEYAAWVREGKGEGVEEGEGGRGPFGGVLAWICKSCWYCFTSVCCCFCSADTVVLGVVGVPKVGVVGGGGGGDAEVGVDSLVAICSCCCTS